MVSLKTFPNITFFKTKLFSFLVASFSVVFIVVFVFMIYVVVFLFYVGIVFGMFLLFCFCFCFVSCFVSFSLLFVLFSDSENIVSRNLNVFESCWLENNSFYVYVFVCFFVVLCVSNLNNEVVWCCLFFVTRLSVFLFASCVFVICFIDLCFLFLSKKLHKKKKNKLQKQKTFFC